MTGLQVLAGLQLRQSCGRQLLQAPVTRRQPSDPGCTRKTAVRWHGVAFATATALLGAADARARPSRRHGVTHVRAVEEGLTEASEGDDEQQRERRRVIRLKLQDLDKKALEEYAARVGINAARSKKQLLDDLCEMESLYYRLTKEPPVIESVDSELVRDLVGGQPDHRLTDAAMKTLRQKRLQRKQECEAKGVSAVAWPEESMSKAPGVPAGKDWTPFAVDPSEELDRFAALARAEELGLEWLPEEDDTDDQGDSDDMIHVRELSEAEKSCPKRPAPERVLSWDPLGSSQWVSVPEALRADQEDEKDANLSWAQLAAAEKDVVLALERWKEAFARDALAHEQRVAAGHPPPKPLVLWGFIPQPVSSDMGECYYFPRIEGDKLEFQAVKFEGESIEAWIQAEQDAHDRLWSGDVEHEEERGEVVKAICMVLRCKDILHIRSTQHVEQLEIAAAYREVEVSETTETMDEIRSECDQLVQALNAR